MYFDDDNKPHKLVGSMRDVTETRETQLALEQQVQARTEELASANEEMTAINEELSESNRLLVKSNKNLQKFAYIASHDLQEPLRKIQSFSDLIVRRHAQGLGEGIIHLERIQSAGKRMSMLIKDLLAFSSLSGQQDKVPVSLTWVLRNVLADLELAIKEANAEIVVDPLPILLGDETQLGQLFQNLVSNALKFTFPDRQTRIWITSATIMAGDLPGNIHPPRLSEKYHCITVADNGVGFSDEYAERIFEVFQRLHTKEQYEGTGIGLAICETVAANHGGAISATSQPGQGATFRVYLPA